MGQEVDDLAGRVRVHARKDVGDIVDGVDGVLFATGDERVEDGEIVAGVLIADKEEILPPEGNSKLILPMSHFELASITRGIRPMARTWRFGIGNRTR